MQYRLEDIETFLQVADTGSITQAAERLCVSKSVISKRIVRLEGMLGIALLHRSTRGVTLTDRGLAFSQRALRIMEDLNLAADEVPSRATSWWGSCALPGRSASARGIWVNCFFRFWPITRGCRCRWIWRTAPWIWCGKAMTLASA